MQLTVEDMVHGSSRQHNNPAHVVMANLRRITANHMQYPGRSHHKYNKTSPSRKRMQYKQTPPNGRHAQLKDS